MHTADEVSRTLRKLADADAAAQACRYFKTAPGQYGHGDRFLGIRVPVLRKHIRDYADMSGNEVVKLLRSVYHEERLFALLIWVRQFDRGDSARRAMIYKRYLQNTRYINNWDLVDLSAPNIVGSYLRDNDRSVLYTLAASPMLWERRIAMLATLAFIRNNDFDDALALARLLRDDREDLMHKASGWMLREIGKRNLKAETAFLDEHADVMPRTMLRYAVEKFPPALRSHYMKLAAKASAR